MSFMLFRAKCSDACELNGATHCRCLANSANVGWCSRGVTVWLHVNSAGTSGASPCSNCACQFGMNRVGHAMEKKYGMSCHRCTNVPCSCRTRASTGSGLSSGWDDGPARPLGWSSGTHPAASRVASARTFSLTPALGAPLTIPLYWMSSAPSGAAVCEDAAPYGSGSPASASSSVTRTDTGSEPSFGRAATAASSISTR